MPTIEEFLKQQKADKRAQDIERITRASSTSDKDKLAKLYPPLAQKCLYLLNACKQSGLPVGLHMGFRPDEMQTQLFALGRDEQGNIIDKDLVVTYARPGSSWHGYALAVDMVFKTLKGNWSWDESYDWQKLGELGKGFGLVWGGDFTKPKDLPHFEYHPGLWIAQAKLLKAAGGLEAVWEKITA